MRVLLYNHSGCENRGCEAIVRSTSALLAQRGAKTILTSGQAESDGGLRLPSGLSPSRFRRTASAASSIRLAFGWACRASTRGRASICR